MAVQLRKTPLYDTHVALGAKMAPFAGFSMPIYYTKTKAPSIMASHQHVRAHAGLFDVSHMLQLVVRGMDAIPFMEKMTVGRYRLLRPLEMRYSLLMNEKGGVVDDLMVGRGEIGDPSLYMVVNAGSQERDIAHFMRYIRMAKKEGLDVDLEAIYGQGLIALQGPDAQKILALHVTEDLSKMKFMTRRWMMVDGVRCGVTRSGYTGEDGFEISIPASHSERIYQNLLTHPDLDPVGLGARDSLRLEAGLCLYGHDLRDDISPVEANLLWAVDRLRRRSGGFLGDELFMLQMKEGVPRKRVGLLPEVIAREDTPILNASGKRVGEVTSGLLSPTLQKPIAMGYVQSDHAKVGMRLQVPVRGKLRDASVAKLPFVQHRYYRGLRARSKEKLV